MASNTITSNSSTKWMVVRESPVHIALAGAFDGASIALEQQIESRVYPVLDDAQAAIVYTTAFDDALNLTTGDKIRLTTTAGGGSLSVDYNVAGAGYER